MNDAADRMERNRPVTCYTNYGFRQSVTNCY